MKKPFLFFDLDNTILDFNWAERNALFDALRETGVEPDERLLARYRELNRQCWELLEDGLLSRDRVLVRRFELLFQELGLSCSPEEVCRRYEHLLTRGHRFLDGAEELLRLLQGRARLFIASNGSAEVQAARIASAGLARYFEDFFISEELGANKPSPAFFRLCFGRIPDFDPALALMIGDSLTSDIRGGINAGIRTCWFNPAGAAGRADIVPDYEIGSLSELPSLLERLLPMGEQKQVSLLPSQ